MKKNLRIHTIWRLALMAPIFLGVALLATEVFARVGGGHSYGGGGGGGSHSGGSGGGGGGALLWLIVELFRFLLYLTIEYPIIGIPLDLIVIGGIVFYFARGRRMVAEGFSSLAPQVNELVANARPVTVGRDFDRLRKFDPNFSEIVFTDFCYALYGKAHEARGRGAEALDLFSPYLSEEARKSLLQRNSAGLREVKGIIVGSMAVSQIYNLDTPLVFVTLEFEANYTEVTARNSGSAAEMTYYVQERWILERKRDLLSPPPAQATALHCPRCGAPLQKDTVGACAFCGTKIDSGEFQWYVRNISVVGSDARGPVLTSDVQEVGTNYPSVVQANFEAVRADFERNNPQFSWGEFEARARLIFDELQAAWSALNWDRARPHETDNLFQMHQYWIDAYRRQHLRNVIENCAITQLQPVKILEDAFYQAITLRIWAQGLDYTMDGSGKVVSGSRSNPRRWSEYWTFIRNRNAKSTAAKSDLNCPNCGSPLKVNASGICEFCGGKITSGEFDWVLSKIEQDESYAG
ncbi:MAG TPA: TIM44-like domain-containing protein [Pyrinomonadaceae bacterium]|nr:TIM44-like domain-containing protein [Pyrinomonadaceae bacterium]